MGNSIDVMDNVKMKVVTNNSNKHANLSNQEKVDKSKKIVDIFLSYCQKDKELADDIDTYFENKGIVLKRDIREVGRWKSFRDFMNSIRDQDFAILLITDNYLKSHNCMYEVSEIMNEKKYENRIFPIVIETKIYDILERITYTKYWQNKCKELEEAVGDISTENIAHYSIELKKYKEIASKSNDFLAKLSEINNPFSVSDAKKDIEKILLDIGTISEDDLINKNHMISELVNSYKYYKSDKGENLDEIIAKLRKVYCNDLNNMIEEFIKKSCENSIYLIEDSYKGFWEYIVHSEHADIRKAFLDYVTKRNECFLNVYKFFPDILIELLETNKHFIQDFINPLLEEWDSFRYGELFWNIMCTVLENDKNNILDVDKIVKRQGNIKLIQYYNDNQTIRNTLNKYNVFKGFILDYDNYFFKNLSGEQWNNSMDDEYMIKIMYYAEWDEEIIKKLEYSYDALKASISYRRNIYSEINGDIRDSSYRKVIIDNKYKIYNIQNIDIDQYKNIKEVLTKDK